MADSYTFELESWNRDISDEQLKCDLKLVANQLSSQTVTMKQYDDCGQYSSRTFETRFGTWNNALTASGLSVGRRQNIPDTELFENLQQVWMTLARQPKWRDMTSPLSKFNKNTYTKRFGTWRSALNEFVAWVESNDDYSTIKIRPKKTSKRTPRTASARLRFRILQRDHFRCQSCGRSPATDSNTIFEVDHIQPWSKGGETTIDNLQTLCFRCNNGKSDCF